MASRDWSQNSASSLDTSRSCSRSPCRHQKSELNNNNNNNNNDYSHGYGSSCASCACEKNNRDGYKDKCCSGNDSESTNYECSYMQSDAYDTTASNAYDTVGSEASYEPYTYDQNQSFTEYMSQSFKRDQERKSRRDHYSNNNLSYCDPATFRECCCCNKSCGKSYSNCGTDDYCYVGGRGSCTNDYNSDYCKYCDEKSSFNYCSECRSSPKTSSCEDCSRLYEKPTEKYDVTAKVLFGSVGAISTMKQNTKSKKSQKKK